MTLRTKHASVFLLSLGLAACGGGGGGSAGGSDGPRNPGDGGQPPAPDYGGHYQDLGMEPRDLPAGLQVDATVASAVVPGYLGFATLMASLDLRMALQAYEWYLPAAAQQAGPITDEGTDAAPYPARQAIGCNQSGQAAIFYWDDADSSGGLSFGEELRFGFQDCIPSFGSVALSSDGAAVAQPRVQRYSRVDLRPYPYHQFSFDGVGMSDYPGFTFSGGALGRYTLDDSEPVKDMILTNSAPGTGDAPGTFTLAGSAAGKSVKVYVQGDSRGVSDPFVIRSRKSTGGLLFDVSDLNVHLELDGVDSDLEGSYVFSTESALDVAYLRPSRMLGGSFKVEQPSLGITYTYSVDADPAYLFVEIDEDGDGEPEASGRISQALITGRLSLAD